MVRRGQRAGLRWSCAADRRAEPVFHGVDSREFPPAHRDGLQRVVGNRLGDRVSFGCGHDRERRTNHASGPCPTIPARSRACGPACGLHRRREERAESSPPTSHRRPPALENAASPASKPLWRATANRLAIASAEMVVRQPGQLHAADVPRSDQRRQDPPAGRHLDRGPQIAPAS